MYLLWEKTIDVCFIGILTFLVCILYVKIISWGSTCSLLWGSCRLGLDEPIHMQYGIWIKNAIHGNFGISYKYKTDVGEVIAARLGNTIWLGGSL